MLTDKDNVLIAAISKFFSRVSHMLCQWHIHKNILMQVTKAFGDDVEGMAKRNQAWFAVLNAFTKAEYYVAEDALLFLELMDSPESLFQYIHKEWLQGDNKKKFVKTWINEYVHFGYKATSVAKEAHRKLKCRLLSRTNDLKTVIIEVRDFIISKQEEICIHHEE